MFDTARRILKREADWLRLGIAESEPDADQSVLAAQRIRAMIEVEEIQSALELMDACDAWEA